jgi:hypothetical protein
VDPVLAKCLEDQLAHDFNPREDSGSDDGSDTLPVEWETVSRLLIAFKTYSISSVKTLFRLL